MVQKYLRPVAVKAGVISGEGSFRFPQLPAFTRNGDGEAQSPKTLQGIRRHENFGTTMELYAQSDMESMPVPQDAY